jgi:phosphatidate cytidylyltransferase
MLRTRILSALVMIPVALGAAWLGNWAFVALMTVAGIALAWEWSRLCLGRFTAGGRILAVGAALLPLAGWLNPLNGLLLIAATALLSGVPPVPEGRKRFWMHLGALYIMLPQLALITIREQGRGPLLWVLFLVWATDSGAYFAGRAIGGPKLAPSVSPKKTWAGLAGGMVAAGLVGWAMKHGIEPGAGRLAIASALLAVVAQAGDLAESGLKRYFGVKDSSQLIPGHGGVLDRLDGLLAVAPAVAALALVSPEGWNDIYGW